MITNKSDCLICDKTIIYTNEEKEMTCLLCNKVFKSLTSCENNHYICDSCHSEKGLNSVIIKCLKSKSKNPIEIIQELMDMPGIHMHGPEHHVLVGSALLTAYYNSGGKINLSESLREMRARGEKYPGGSCGFWGCCGAAVSSGMFYSIIEKCTPLGTKCWGEANTVTANALLRIGEIGGPRCCKRNSFAAIEKTTEYVKETKGIAMEQNEKKLECKYFKDNKSCKKTDCPYFPVK